MGLNKKQQAIADQLGRRVELCREFMNDWLLFNQVLSAYPNPGVNKAQLENQFLKIKSKLAREHRVLKDLLQEDYGIDGNAMNIVSGATSLESIYAQSDVAVKKLQTEWHRAFISVNETLGTLEDKKSRADMGEKIIVSIPGQVATKSGGGNQNTTTYIIIAAVIAAIAAVLILDIGGLGTTYRNMLGL